MTAAVRSPDGCASQCIDVGDGAISITVSGNGPPLILLHGWTLDRRMWAPQVAELGERYRLIMPDRRGFGRSTAPPDLTRECDDVLRIADTLGIDRFYLAGLSQGAGVALDIAVCAPDRVTAVALAGTPLPGLVADPDHVPRDDYVHMLRNGDGAMMRRAWLLHPLMQVDHPEVAARIAEIVADYDGRDLLQPSALPQFTRASIAALPMPLLAVAGDAETPWRIDCAQLLAAVAPRGRFVSIADAGHMTNVAQPKAFNAVLLQFFGSHRPG